MSGIYKITCTGTKRFYIGSAVNLKKRWVGHRNRLRKGCHSNPILQNTFNKYGESSLCFEVIEQCEKDKCLMIEQIHLDIHKDNPLLMNIMLIAGGGDTLSRHPMKSEIIAKRTASLKLINESLGPDGRKQKYGNYGQNNASYGGGHFSESTLAKLREYGREGAQIRKNQIQGKTYDDIYGVSRSLEIRKKQSEIAKQSQCGTKNNFYGKKHSEVVKQKLRDNMTGKYGYNKSKPFSIDGVSYISLKQASDTLGIPLITIRYRLNSKNFLEYRYD